MSFDLDVSGLVASSQLFLLLLARTAALLTAVPVLSERGVPVQARVGLAVLVSFLVLPTVHAPEGMPWRWELAGVAVLGEVLTGLFMGFCVQGVFEAVAVACRIFETQMGYAMGSTAFPGAGGGHSAIGSLFHAMALVLFFTSGAYRMLLRGLVRSFTLVAPGGVLSPQGDVAIPLDAVVGVGSRMLVCALEIAAPVMGAVFMADVALGLLARAVPQMNVFAVGFPVKIMVGLLAAVASLALFAHGFSHALQTVMAGLLARAGRV